MHECIISLVLSAALGGGTEQFLVTGTVVQKSGSTWTLDATDHVKRLVAEKHIAPTGHILTVKPDACMAVEYE